MISVLHLSDIHLGSGLAYGQINPDTGINTRLEDFVNSLSQCIDRAIAQPVDLVVFGGDAFPDATPPPLHQDLFAHQFRRLADAGIPTVLLVGNHDQYGQGQEGTSLAIYRTLRVNGFFVGDKLQTFRIQTPNGWVQVTTLPWLNRSVLLTRQETIGRPAQEVGLELLRRLQVLLEAEIRQLDPQIPSILLAHAMVDTAKYGSERHLAVGKGFTVPLSLLARSAYQYVALGHVHRHQVLCSDPLMIYPGSLERIDFGEEQETKGFVIVDMDQQGSRFEFVPLAARPFRTIRVDLTHLPDLPELLDQEDQEEQKDPLVQANHGRSQGDPHVNRRSSRRSSAQGQERSKTSSQPRSCQEEILRAIARTDIEAAIVRLIYRVRPNQLDQLDEAGIHAALKPAFNYTITPEVISPLRTRLPGLDPSQVEPLQALEHYLQTREDLAGLQGDMMAAAQQLFESTDLDELEFEQGQAEVETDGIDPVFANWPVEQQLRLL